MVVDTEGNLWIAVFASHRVIVFNTPAKHLKNVVFSANNMACTTWGGKDHDIIFVATGIDKSPDRKPDDEGGYVFRYRPRGFKGFPKYEFAG